MRSLNVKVNSVGFCGEEELEGHRKRALLKEFFRAEKEKGYELGPGKEGGDSEELPPTNLELFRAYAEALVKEHPGINTELFCLVRQLEASSQGIPLQVYAFTYDKTLVGHSEVISEIFSHLIAIAPSFGLEVFETPSGADIRDHLSREGQQNV